MNAIEIKNLSYSYKGEKGEVVMNKLEQEAAKIAEVEVDMMQQTGYITIREVEEYKKRLKEKIINIAKTNNTDALLAFEKMVKDVFLV